MRKTIFILCTLALGALPAMAQQQPPAVRYPRPSQHAALTQTVGVTDVTIEYSRPGVKGRKIWGGLVPYGQVWPTGANEATTITFSDDVTIDGKPLPKGAYSLHTIPGPDQWTIIFNKEAKQWGSYSYKQSEDALRIVATPHAAPMTEWLEFDVPELTSDKATIEIRWEKLAVPFTVDTNSTEKTLASAKAAIDAAKADDWRTAYGAANFAFNAGRMAEANAWVERSIKAKETVRNLYLKAQMEAKAGHHAAAIKTAEAALKLATPEDKELAGEIEKSISGWKK